MIPVLFSIGEFNVYAFGFFLAVSFLLSTFVVWKYGKEELKEEEYLDAFLYTAVAVLLGARVSYILGHFDEFGINLLRYIVVRETPGLSIFGGLLTGILFLFWYTRKRKLPFWHLTDLFSLSSSFGLFFTKIGEQLGGGSFGKETNFILGTRVVGKTGLFHPVELYEAIFIILLSFVLVFIHHKTRKDKWPEGTVATFFILGLGFIFFLLDFLKKYPLYFYGLSLKQFFAIIMISSILIPLFKRVKIIRAIHL